jgi:hypothetical protein
MAISFDILTPQPLAAPIAPPPPRAPAIAAAAQRDTTQNDRKNQAQPDRERAKINFRSILDAATLSGIGRAFGAETAQVRQDGPQKRASKLPGLEPEVISSTEAASLYRSAKSADTTGNVRASEFRAASLQYAKSFFAVSGTFAKPGESLELTA